jgi:hypothetical protein
MSHECLALASFFFIFYQFPSTHLGTQICDHISPVQLSPGSFIIIIIHLFTCAYIVWVISPSCPKVLRTQANALSLKPCPGLLFVFCF